MIGNLVFPQTATNHAAFEAGNDISFDFLVSSALDPTNVDSSLRVAHCFLEREAWLHVPFKSLCAITFLPSHTSFLSFFLQMFFPILLRHWSIAVVIINEVEFNVRTAVPARNCLAGCRLVFALKFHGGVEWPKAGLMGNTYSSRGADYIKDFSLEKLNLVKAIISVAANLCCHLPQLWCVECFPRWSFNWWS